MHDPAFIARTSDAKLLRRLRVLRRRIDAHTQQRQDALDERVAIWRELDGRGVDRPALWEASGVTRNAVNQRLHQAAKRDTR